MGNLPECPSVGSPVVWEGITGKKGQAPVLLGSKGSGSWLLWREILIAGTLAALRAAVAC